MNQKKNIYWMKITIPTIFFFSVSSLYHVNSKNASLHSLRLCRFHVHILDRCLEIQIVSFTTSNNHWCQCTFFYVNYVLLIFAGSFGRFNGRNDIFSIWYYGRKILMVDLARHWRTRSGSTVWGSNWVFNMGDYVLLFFSFYLAQDFIRRSNQ